MPRLPLFNPPRGVRQGIRPAACRNFRIGRRMLTFVFFMTTSLRVEERIDDYSFDVSRGPRVRAIYIGVC